MDKLLVSLAIKFAVGALARTGANTKWGDEKVAYNAWVVGLGWGDFFTAELTSIGDAVLDDVAKACQDTVDLTGVLDALAAKDWVGAEKALKALLVKAAGGSPYIAALVGAA